MLGQLVARGSLPTIKEREANVADEGTRQTPHRGISKRGVEIERVERDSQYMQRGIYKEQKLMQEKLEIEREN